MDTTTELQDSSPAQPSIGSTPFTFDVVIAIVVSVVIVLLVVGTVIMLCWYCTVKRRRAREHSTRQVVQVFQNGKKERKVKTVKQQVKKDKRPVTKQIVQVLRGKKKKKDDDDTPQPVVITSALDHAQVNVQNHFKEGGYYDVSINGIAHEAFIAPAPPEPEPEPVPVIVEPVPLPAPHPTPKPEPGTTIYSVGEQVLPAPRPAPPPAQPTITTLMEQYGPTIYTVPVAPSASHGYSVQTASFDIPRPMPVPMLQAAPPSAYQPTAVPAFVQPQPPVYSPTALPMSYTQPQFMGQYVPNMAMQSNSMFTAQPLNMAPMAAAAYPGPAMSMAQQPDTITYGGEKNYAVTLPNISLQTAGGYGNDFRQANMGYNVHH